MRFTPYKIGYDTVQYNFIPLVATMFQQEHYDLDLLHHFCDYQPFTVHNSDVDTLYHKIFYQNLDSSGILQVSQSRSFYKEDEL